jgi:hypothetical protein
MKEVMTGVTQDQMIDLVSYVASLEP